MSTAAKPTQKSILAHCKESLIGQDHAVELITPYISMYHAGLAPGGRPIGVFLLLGPTGTGKTHTVEIIAEALHGSKVSLTRIDCGEFQMDHEVAKLIGAPPGYLGHRETVPQLTQAKLNATASDNSNISILLLDEIEKAAPSMMRLLLGVLDKGQLKLGDNTMVNFDRTLVFMTSNLGAEQMQVELNDRFGLAQGLGKPKALKRSQISKIGEHAVRRKFAPEFVNRIDAMIAYAPLDEASLRKIINLQVDATVRHIHNRAYEMDITFTVSAREWLLEHGTSPKWGARELKRLLLRKVLQPVAALIEESKPSKLIIDVIRGDMTVAVVK